jgi:hypothetical protein
MQGRVDNREEKQGQIEDVGVMAPEAVHLDRTLADAVVSVLGALIRGRVGRRPIRRPVRVRTVAKLFRPAKDRAKSQEADQQSRKDGTHRWVFRPSIKLRARVISRILRRIAAPRPGNLTASTASQATCRRDDLPISIGRWRRLLESHSPEMLEMHEQ